MKKKNKQKAIFLDRDGVINKEVSYLCKPEDFILYPFTGHAIKKINESDFYCIVITNQSAVARNMCTIEDIEIVHNKMRELVADYNAGFDAVYYCPHLPNTDSVKNANKYNIECDCRKPKIGMIKQALKEFSIDLSNSYMIGDSPRDILCGKNAGLKTIGVKTGHACKGIEISPDYYFENLKEAVDFIV